MKRLKLAIFAIAIIMFFGFLVVLKYKENRINYLSSQVERLKDNVGSLLEENADLKVLNLQKDEVIGSVRRQRDSLAERLKIKPKFIEKIIETKIIQYDTIEKIVEVKRMNDTVFLIKDQEPCWSWEGKVKVDSCGIEIRRMNFVYANTIEEVFFYRHKFLFLGKKYYRKSIPKCGEVKVTEINFIKARGK